MVNKKGYIRTLEAIIAIVIIFIFIISILPKKDINEKTPDDIDLTGQGILNEIQNNKEYRDYVINMIITGSNAGKDTSGNYVYTSLKDSISSDITKPVAIDYNLMICDINTATSCYPTQADLDLSLPKSNIYTKSILINTDSGNNRLVKLYLWRKV